LGGGGKEKQEMGFRTRRKVSSLTHTVLTIQEGGGQTKRKGGKKKDPQFAGGGKKTSIGETSL